ncbi:dipeptidase [Allonocardiopsis opalescens]|uniref:Membrane dipeptidase n=1 Tax=Allonocardiopsis opalescens TaxID=1144618 RepID=A0A2T0QEE6_9ACTN|nr:membrane dipeptidase [Allonocardiopsis opalescens]PRY02272.1 membrane dipeptidase [Allonocardiopsis opalescens]
MTTTQQVDDPAALHRDSLVVEAHRDCYEQIHWSNMGEENPVRDRLLPRLSAGGVDLVVYAVGGDTIAHSNGRDKKLLATIENIEGLNAACADPGTRTGIVTRSAELPGAPDGIPRFLLHLEGGSPLEGSLAALDALFRLGVRSMQPTWNVRNELGDGVHERDSGGGLTRFGVDAVRRMERLGMMVDLSHISESGFWHTLRVTEGPVVVTHANARAVFEHPRNLSDEQVRALAERGGVVGVHTLPIYVGGEPPKLSGLIDHVVHFVELVGVEHVGFGGDFVACDGPRPGREALFHDPRKAPPVLDELVEADQMANFTAALAQRGFTAAEIRALIGGNFLRVLRAVLPE